jgi:hypothetical protein
MTIHVQSPTIFDGLESTQVSVYLAGGISHCCLWQTDLEERLANLDYLVTFNPRRTYGEMSPEVTGESFIRDQIAWERKYQDRADIISFWFSHETINPIALFELGLWAKTTDKPIIVGLNTLYQRKADIKYQLRVLRPDITIEYSLAGLAAKIKEAAESLHQSRLNF